MAVRAKGYSNALPIPKLIFVEDGGRLAVDIEKGIKLLTTVVHFKYEETLSKVCINPGKLLASACKESGGESERLMDTCLPIVLTKQVSAYRS